MTVALDFETRLRQAYDRHFTRHKRQPTRALGWPATLWLVYALDRWHAESVLECGSGWSSTALRMWAAEGPGRSIVTTDHKPAWLNLAQMECVIEDLDSEGFVYHDALAKDRQFDVVLVDLADTPTRFSRLDDFVRWVKPGGYLVFDDWHVETYQKAVMAWFARHHLAPPTKVLPSTDEWGRHLAIWRAP
jgi:ubiquinone/menaquinone biosynthesis C-methylase UbiE